MLIPTPEEMSLRKSFSACRVGDDVAEELVQRIVNERELQSFYSSQILLRLSSAACDFLLEQLERRFNTNAHLLKIRFLKTQLPKLRDREATVAATIRDRNPEDVIQLFEYVLARIRHFSIGPDGKKYDEEILASQHEHLTSVFSDAVRCIFELRLVDADRIVTQQ